MKGNKEDFLYSLIIPVFNSEQLVGKTVEECLTFSSQSGLKIEIILVDDGSNDNSWNVISRLVGRHSEVVAVRLLRNYGQHTAVLCGMKYAKGDYLVTLDDDLQNPPVEIEKLIDKILEGHDLVFAQFEQKQHKRYRRLGTRVIDFFNCQIFGKPKSLILTNFRIFTREVAERALRHKTVYPYIPGLLLLSSRSRANTLTRHDPRSIGGSNYSLWRIIKLVARLLFNYSSWPLHVLTAVGFCISTLGFALGGFYLIKALFLGTNVPGWSSLIVIISMFSGIIIIMLGVIGEYIARILNQVSVREPYEVGEVAQ